MVNGSRNRVLVALGVLAVGLLGIVAGLALAGGDDDPKQVRADGSDSADTTLDASADTTDTTGTDGSDGGGAPTVAPPTSVATAGLTGPALDLANAINAAATLTYHAVYEGDHVSETGTTSRATVEIWRQLPLARRDTKIASADGTLTTRELRLRDDLLGCVDKNKGDTDPDWICVPSAGKGVDPADPVLGIARPTAGTVTVRDDTVGGVLARCYTVSGDGGKVQEVCFDADGIPVSIDGGDSRLVRTEVGRGVDPDTIAVPEGAEMRASAEPAEPS